MLVRSGYWRDLLVGSAEYRWITHPSSPGTTSVPLRPFGGTCLSGPLVGGTCLSRPPPNVRSSIGVHRGLKSRAERGAKAPHSMECGDSSPLFDEGFSLHHLGVCGVWRGRESGALEGAIHELTLPGSGH
ncbi:hypothetical protein THTE_0473 [Thermogutta terrifontis]|uniref:Uncharacterized protein n=1 Tax=Thermogutta terrifontis TaxID=1331910 RepID=A0A286RAU4_9BACT|nr:hypothetical protein THTE_0473 [Thermogutta terrifontis]